MLEEGEEFYCNNCRNTGMEFPDCEECEGNGWVDDPSDGGTMSCPDCDGEICGDCDGRTTTVTPPNATESGAEEKEKIDE